jgi:hypothetical protein
MRDDAIQAKKKQQMYYGVSGDTIPQLPEGWMPLRMDGHQAMGYHQQQ